MTLVIEIELDTEAFEDDGIAEVKRILEDVVSRIPNPLDVSKQLQLHDAEGFHCGTARIVE